MAKHYDREFTTMYLLSSWMSAYKGKRDALPFIGEVITAFGHQTPHSKKVSLFSRVKETLPLNPIATMAIMDNNIPVLEALHDMGFNWVNDHHHGGAKRPFYNDPLAQTIFGDNSAFFAAIKHNKLEALHWLMTHSDVSKGIFVPDHKLNEGHTTLLPPDWMSPLAWAMHYERPEGAEALLQHAKASHDQKALDDALFILVENNRITTEPSEFYFSWMTKLFEQGANPHALFDVDDVGSYSSYKWFFGSVDGLNPEDYPSWKFDNNTQHQSGCAYALCGRLDIKSDYSEEKSHSFRAGQRWIESDFLTQLTVKNEDIPYVDQIWKENTPENFHQDSLIFIQKIHQLLSDSSYRHKPPQTLCRALMDPQTWKKNALPSWFETAHPDHPYCLWLDLVGLQARLDGLDHKNETEYTHLNEQWSLVIEGVMDALPLPPHLVKPTFQRIIKTSYDPFNGPVLKKIIQQFNDDQRASLDHLCKQYNDNQIQLEDEKKKEWQVQDQNMVKILKEKRELLLQQLPEVVSSLLANPTPAKRAGLRL